MTAKQGAHKRPAADPSPSTPRWLDPAFYVGLSAVTVVTLVWVMKLWLADLTVPLQYQGDALFAGASIKGMIETGQALINPHLGAPGSMNLLDYPGTDFLHFVAMRLISLFTSQWALVVNIYFLLGFVIVALAAAWSSRRLGLSRPVSFALAILYTFLPFHFLHGQTHIFLSLYYQVPLLCVLAIELQAAVAPLVSGTGDEAKLDVSWARAWLPLGICALAGASGIYYALFGCIFIGLAGLRAWWRTGERARAISAAIMVAVILAVTLACLSPYVWYRHSAGTNPEVASRSFVEAEVYGLKVAQMVLPVRDHRIGLLARVREHYISVVAATFGQLTDSETDFTALGLIGTLGFLGLVWVAILGRRGRGDPADARLPIDAVATLAVAGTLLATVGGFGTVIALGFTQIRAYARISVFLAFFALIAVGYFIDRVADRTPKGNSRWLLIAVAGVLVVVGVLDQTTSAMVPAYAQTAAAWHSTGAFVAQVESNLPDGAQVFQLPYVPFPENPPVVNMIDYDHFSPYLLSRKIHWSYGAVKGREAAQWNQQVSAMPVAQMIAQLKGKGFVGVWIDRAGYQDQGDALISSLSKATGEQPRTSSDNRYAFFALAR